MCTTLCVMCMHGNTSDSTQAYTRTVTINLQFVRLFRCIQRWITPCGSNYVHNMFYWINYVRLFSKSYVFRSIVWTCMPCSGKLHFFLNFNILFISFNCIKWYFILIWQYPPYRIVYRGNFAQLSNELFVWRDIQLNSPRESISNEIPLAIHHWLDVNKCKF